MDTSAPGTSIRHWPEQDRPREKLFRLGEQKLSDSELLAILLNSGGRGFSALDLSRRVLARFKSFRNMAGLDAGECQDIRGLGMTKIARIRAAIEIGRRFRSEASDGRPLKIGSSREAAEVLMPRMRDLKKEVFTVIFLNSRHRVIEMADVEEGTVNSAAPMVREIFQLALQRFAVSLICAHNHPSGDITPSAQDREFTLKIRAAGEALGVKVLDHIIVGDNVYYSFADEGGV
ncbi:MAG: DNA repair protein RadC [Candidatus Omnitrophota bacterium]|nr:DNA repair protein RadC [Candidatus Omnitrophota bacterium]